MILGQKHNTCRLCLNESKLCASHVVPEFFYEYDDSEGSRRALVLRIPEEGPAQKKTIQKGHREYLLCAQCEQILNKHERVFAPFWKSNIRGPFQIGQGMVLKGMDYHSTKLLLISVFWRASLSEWFGQIVKLGPYSEKLRNILINNEPVKQNEYPLIARLLLNDDGTPFTGVTQPYTQQFDLSQGYVMCFGGCEWTIIMSDQLPKRLQPLGQLIRENGDLHLCTAHVSQNPFLRKMGKKL